MALIIKDRVKETTTTTGTGNVALGGAVSNFVTFSSVLSDSDTTYYAIVDSNNSDFEVGLGTYVSSGNTIARTTVLASSNSGSAVNLSSGSKVIFCAFPADKAVVEDADGVVSIENLQFDTNAIKSTNSNGNIQLFPAGTGFTELYGNTNAGKIRFNCESNSHGVTLQGPPHSASATYTLELPNSDGTAGQLLKTDGSGKLSFTTVDASPSLTATASGALSNGDTVIINSDGTVTAVGTSVSALNPPTKGTAVEFEAGTTGSISAVFDPDNNKVVVAYSDQGDSSKGKVVIGTVSGTSISFGTPVEFEAGNTSYIAVAYDTNADRVVIAYSDNDFSAGAGTAIVGTVSGTSISFGSVTVFNNAETNYIGITFDSSNNKVVIVYRDSGNSNYGTAVVGTVSGTSISFDAGVGEIVFNSGNTFYASPTFDSNANKVVVAYRDQGDSNKGKAIVGTVSGTSISFGTAVVFDGNNGSEWTAATFDSSNNKVVIFYQDDTDTETNAIVGTVSGTSISFGTAVQVLDGNNVYHNATFDSTANNVLVVLSEETTEDIELFVGTVSGTSISFGTALKVAEHAAQVAVVYDTNAQKGVVLYDDDDDSSKGKGVVTTVNATTTNLTSENFVGISDAAYSNSATATIQVGGSVDDAQSSLTPGQVYYVQDNGSLGLSPDSVAVVAGVAVSSTKLLIDQATRDANLAKFGSVFTLPTSDGSANQILKTDGSGNLGFTTVASGGLTHLSTVTASSASTVDIETTFDSTYDSYKLIITDMTVATNGAQVQGVLKIGGSYITSGTYDYLHRRLGVDGGGNIYSNGSGNANNVLVAVSTGNHSYASANFEFSIYNTTDTAVRHVVRFEGSYYEDNGSQIFYVYGVGQNSTTGALTGIRFQVSTGTISGKFRLYGITNG